MDSVKEPQGGITVVIPVRNTPKKVLKECLDSILSQSMMPSEIICVDDASDNGGTIEVLDIYENNNSSIQVIKLEHNIGAGNARNIGLEATKTEYILFFDSDDIMNQNFLQNLYHACKSENADVAVSGYVVFERNFKGDTILFKIKNDIHYEQKEWDMLIKDGVSPCNKLCRTELLIRENIRFQSLTSDNDTFYAIMVLLCANKVVFSGDNEGFKYRYNTGYQITSRRNPYNIIHAITKAKSEIVLKPRYNRIYSVMIDSYFIRLVLEEIRKISNQKDAEEFYKACQDFIVNYIEDNDTPIMKYIYMWKNYDYESKWFELVGDYLQQLRLNEKGIMNSLKKANLIYVWGMGKRGHAFRSFAKERGIQIYGFYDSNPYNSEIKVNEDNILFGNGVIVATNHVAYEYILSKNIDNKRVLDLEQYCSL